MNLFGRMLGDVDEVSFGVFSVLKSGCNQWRLLFVHNADTPITVRQQVIEDRTDHALSQSISDHCFSRNPAKVADSSFDAVFPKRQDIESLEAVLRRAALASD